MTDYSKMSSCRILVSAPVPVPVPFLWTLDLGFGTWIWDLDLGLGFGTGLGLDNYYYGGKFSMRQETLVNIATFR